jgi:hypothetical protein
MTCLLIEMRIGTPEQFTVDANHSEILNEPSVAITG